MRIVLLITSSTLSFGLMFLAPPVLAQTPDGETPAEEAVCDPLKADGITKGLYGLCVAFCEAQDDASYDTPMTEEGIEALMDEAPSGRILANYNRKKDNADNPADPDMPCILVEEPCPCFTPEEIASLDGLNNDDGETSYIFDCIINGPLGDPFTQIRMQENDPNSASSYTFAYVFYGNDGFAQCAWHENSTRIRTLNTNGTMPTLTLGQANECKPILQAACDAKGLPLP